MLGCLGQVHGGSLGFLGGARHLHGGHVDRRDEFAQLVDRVVDGVGDRTGEVFGYRRGHRQVTVGEVGDLIEQTQNRGLVTFVLLGGFGQSTVGLLHHHQADDQNRTQRQGAQHVAGDGVQRAARGQPFEALGEGRGLVEQGLRNGEDGVGRFTNLEQLRRGFENLVHRTGYEFEQLGNLAEALQGFLVADLGDLHGRVAFLHRAEHATEQAGVATEHVGSLHRVLVTGEHLVHRAENTFGEQRLTLGDRYLGRWRTALEQDVDHFLVLDLQLRNGFGQGGGNLVQRQNGLFAGQNGVGVLAQGIPVLLHGGHLRLHRCRCGRQAGLRVTVGQVGPTGLEIVAGIAQQGEGFGLARGGFGGILGDTLGQHAQFTGVAEVLGVVVTLRIHVREVGEQHHDRNDQDDEQPRHECADPCPRQHIVGDYFFHYLAPAWTLPHFEFHLTSEGWLRRPHRKAICMPRPQTLEPGPAHVG